jgi:hypothetical protein
MKSLFIFAFVVMTTSSFAADYSLQKVRTLGPMKHKVIFQSADLRKIKKTNVIKGKLIAQWGLHVYEVVNGFYSCNKDKRCKLTDYERVATFEKCTVKSKTRVECRKRLDGGISGSSSGSNSDVIFQDDPDSIRDDFGRSRYDDRETEFPARVRDEFEDVF